MSDKRYTVAEATALLPYLAPTLVELRERFEEAARIRLTIETVARSNGGSHERDDWNHTLARVAELLDRLGEWGLELRDIGTGLVDFPTEIEGHEAWLCWRLGEPEVAHWHGTDEGFSGRHLL